MSTLDTLASSFLFSSELSEEERERERDEDESRGHGHAVGHDFRGETPFLKANMATIDGHKTATDNGHCRGKVP